MEKKPFKIGITGGIGTGKTIVSSIFEVLGIPVYNADIRAKELMASKPELIKEIQHLIGEKAFSNGIINRVFIANAVFKNKKLLDQLNAIVHPAVQTDFQEWVITKNKASYILKEAALLFESGSYKSLDKVISVYCPMDLRIKRLEVRDSHRSKEQILSIINQQMDEEEKMKMADFIITNDEKSLVITQVLNIHSHLQAPDTYVESDKGI